MKYITTLILLAFSVVCFSQTKTIYYDADWNVIKDKKNASFYRNIEPYKEDKTHFLVKDFYITGERQMEAVMSSLDPEVNDGYANFYHKNGKQHTARNYINGKENGRYKEWYPNGELEMEGDIKDDKKTGLWKYWYANKKEQTEGVYVNDGRQGEWTFNQIDGTPYLKKTYQNELVKMELLKNQSALYEYFSSFDSTGQDNLAPVIDYSTNEEFKITEPFIKNNIQFLETDTKLDEFDITYGYTMLWLTNNPYLGKFGLNLSPYVANIVLKLEKSYAYQPLMFKMYTIGLGKYSIENFGNKKNETQAMVAGTESMIKLYKSLKAKYPKETSKSLDKLSEIYDKGKLYDFITDYK